MNEKKAAEKKSSETDEEAPDLEREPKKRSYYYDDAHGYEIYNPEDEDNENDED